MRWPAAGLVLAPGVVQRAGMRRLAAVLSLVISVSTLRADRAEEIAQIHIEAMGGLKRIEALKSLRATGHVATGKKQMRFTMTAARPARVRVETDAGGRTLVQATDGAEPAWEFDTGTWPPKYREMNAATARTFVADAEYDDPLVARESRGYTLDYAGEIMVDGRKLLRVLVTHKLSATFSLLLDEETFVIVKRVEHRESAGGRKVQLVTHYEDYRPVDGVLFPFTITLAVDGKATQQTKISRIEPNPDLTNVVFTRPKAAVPPAQSP